MKKTALILLTAAIITLPLLSLNKAMARDQGDRPQERGYHHGPHAPGGDGSGPPCAFGDLSEKDRAAIEAERKAFLKDTRDLRRAMADKEWDLRREITADKPDAKKAAAIQKELSGLRAEFDQKLLTHRLRMRALMPDDEDGFGPGMGMGRFRGAGEGGGCDGGYGGGFGGGCGRGPCSW